MRRWNYAALLLSVAWLWPTFAAAQAPEAKSDLAANAAIQYWQAFALMPTLDKDQEKLLDEWDKVPLDGEALKLINSSFPSMMYLRRAAKLPRCDWGLDYNDGISMMMPHLGKARTLSRLAALHARMEFEQGNWKAGREDATALMVLARHVGRDRVLVAMMVRYLIEGTVVDLVAPYVPHIKAPAAEVASMYEALPAAVPLPQVILSEKQLMTPSMIRVLKEAEERKPGGWRDLWNKFLDGPQVPDALKKVESLEQVIKLMEDTLPVYDELAKMVVLPKEEFDAKWPEFKKQTKAANPMAGTLLPAMDQVLAKERRNQVRMAMLMAAIAVAQEGPEKLKEIKDPFGTGPFEYRALDKGFELKSKLLFEDQPVTLTVGPRKQR